MLVRSDAVQRELGMGWSCRRELHQIPVSVHLRHPASCSCYAEEGAAWPSLQVGLSDGGITLR